MSPASHDSLQRACDLAASVAARRVVQVGGSTALSLALARGVHRTTRGRGGLVIMADLGRSRMECGSAAELGQSGSAEYVHVFVGDPRCTLQGVEGPFDLVWLDCSAELAADVLTILGGRLREGALVAGFAAERAFEAASRAPGLRLRSGSTLRTRARGSRLQGPAA